MSLLNHVRCHVQVSNKRHFEEIYKELLEAGTVCGPMTNGELTTGKMPFNVFARISAGEMDQPENQKVGWLGTDKERQKLEDYQEEFLVACNRFLPTARCGHVRQNGA